MRGVTWSGSHFEMMRALYEERVGGELLQAGDPLG